MRLRSFTASDMQAAMAQVREALGEDAIILSAVTDKSRKKVTVTAALEEEDSLPVPPPPSASGLRAIAGNAAGQEWQDELAGLLRWHNTPEPLAGRLLYKARHLELDALFALNKFGGEDKALMEAKALSRLLADVFRFSPLPLSGAQCRLMLVGPPGIGKTLAVAKLAAQASMEKRALTVITTDTKRAGGVEQLAAFTDILGLPLHVAETPEKLTLLLATTAGQVLIDSAGCNPYDAADMEELTGFIATGAFEPVLTLPAGMDAFEAADTARAFAFTAISRLLVTRADSCRRFGSLLAAADARSLAFCHLGDSCRVVGELKTLDAGRLAQLMLHTRKQTG